jgi:hypothetical protein
MRVKSPADSIRWKRLDGSPRGLDHRAVSHKRSAGPRITICRPFFRRAWRDRSHCRSACSYWHFISGSGDSLARSVHSLALIRYSSERVVMAIQPSNAFESINDLLGSVSGRAGGRPQQAALESLTGRPRAGLCICGSSVPLPRNGLSQIQNRTAGHLPAVPRCFSDLVSCDGFAS